MKTMQTALTLSKAALEKSSPPPHRVKMTHF